MDAVPNTLRRPLDVARAEALADLVADLDPTDLHWVSGFMAGLASERARGAPREVPSATQKGAQEAHARILVLYASQTGNGRRVAERLGRGLEASGMHPVLVAAGDYAPKQLAAERIALLVASTHGDGEAPDDAKALMDHLFGRKAPRLEQLSFAVLALGDSSYPKFCATGRALDERLVELGARRLCPRVDCDVDVDAKANGWLEQVVALTRTETGASAPRLTIVTPLRPTPTQAATRDQPVELELLTNQRITARDAARDVRHLELELPEHRLDYEPGDALGVWIDNPADIVDRVLALTKLDGSIPVTLDGTSHTLGEWLTQRREVTRLARPLIDKIADASPASDLKRWLEPANAATLRAVFKTWQVTDLLQSYPIEWTPETLVRALHPISPRLYSIASSRREVGDEAHLTVAVVDYSRDGERRHGAASWQLAQQAVGTTLRAYIEPNTRFRLPTDGQRDVIMIGPGTGVAPFRGFMQSRIADGARGRHWLVFGGRHREADFLYQTEWLSALKKQQLTRLDVAFSRDQDHKIYVQDRLREQGAELFRWLEEGAHLYVCGDAEHMAPDVHRALLEIISRHGHRSDDAATEYLANLTAERRYLRDVY